MMTQIYDLAYEVDEDGSVNVEQDAGCGEVSRITLHPIHVRLIAEQVGKGMLMAQAATLDVIFNEMARKAAGLVKLKEDGTWSFTADTMDALTRIAFKAQSQCRATLQTLGDLVNPRSVVFAKQANMTNGGPQQVNNGAAEPGAEGNARGKKTEFPQNKLLEDARDGGTYLDTGATSTPARGNPEVETVEHVHRPAKPGRQGRRG